MSTIPPNEQETTRMSPLGYPSNLLAPGQTYETVNETIGSIVLRNRQHADLDANPPAPWLRFRSEIAAVDGVLFVTPEYNRGIPGALKNAIDVGSRPYGQSVFAKKPAAVVTASPGGTGGFGCNHQLRQCCVFLDMPMMAQPEAYLGHVTDESFDAYGHLKDGPLKDVVTNLAHAFAGWVDLIIKGRAALA